MNAVMANIQFLYSGTLGNDKNARLGLACVASVYERFRSKERGTRVKDRAKNGASKRTGRGRIFLVLV